MTTKLTKAQRIFYDDVVERYRQYRKRRSCATFKTFLKSSQFTNANTIIIIGLKLFRCKEDDLATTLAMLWDNRSSLEVEDLEKELVVQTLYTRVPDTTLNNTVAQLKINDHHRNVDLSRLLLQNLYGETPPEKATVLYQYNPTLKLDLTNPFDNLATSLKPLIDKGETLLVKIDEITDKRKLGIDQSPAAVTEQPKRKRQKSFDGVLDQPKVEVPKLAADLPFLENLADNEEVVKLNAVPITKKDFKRLDAGQELNDNNVDFYFQLIQLRAEQNRDTNPSVHAFPTFLWQVINSGQSFDVHLAKWTKNIDVSDFDLLLFPINRYHHWSLAVVDQRSNMIEYFDPLKFGDNGVTDIVRDYLINEHLYYKGRLLPKTHWQIRMADRFIRQNNGTDCGAYICAFAKWRTSGFTMSPTDVSEFRTRMKKEIWNGAIE